MPVGMMVYCVICTSLVMHFLPLQSLIYERVITLERIETKREPSRNRAMRVHQVNARTYGYNEEDNVLEVKCNGENRYTVYPG